MSLDVYLIENICEKCGHGDEVFNANITHNLNRMAMELGIYEHLWRPEDIGIKKANELIEPIARAIFELRSHQKYYKNYEGPNGFGTIKGFAEFMSIYLLACKQYPDATIKVQR